MVVARAALATAALLTAAVWSAPAPRVRFSRQVLPVLARECFSCHNAPAAPGGYAMDTPERLLAGGRHGAAVVAGRPAQSLLPRYLTGELKPQMPPGKPLSLETVALIRRWIDEGARIDGMTPPADTAARPTAPGAAAGAGSVGTAPVTALACAPDGGLVAVGGFRAVRLLDPATGAIRTVLPGPADQVLTTAWSSDGRWLAAGGGLSGAYGELCVWRVPEPGGAWPPPRVVRPHADTITALAWRPGTSELATASMDRTVRLRDAAADREIAVLKEHVEAVLAVACSPDGRWLVTAGADRTVKLYDAATRTRAANYSHPDAVQAVAFSERGTLLLTACADRQVRAWPARPGGAENPLRARGEGDAINSLYAGPDDALVVWGAANRKVRLWSADLQTQRRELDGAADWVFAVTVTPDGRRVLAGAADGKVYIWSAADGRLERVVAASPGGAAR